MDAVAEIGRNPVSKHQVQPENGDERADAEPVSRDQTLRHLRGQGNIHFPCSENRGEMGRSLVTTGRMVMMRSIGYK